jgi:hypothetical protein
MQSLGEDKVFCKLGHEFASIEEAEKPVAAPKPRAVKAKAAEPAPAAVAVLDPPPNLESAEEAVEVAQEITDGAQELKEAAEAEEEDQALAAFDVVAAIEHAELEEEVAQAHAAPPKIVRVQPREMLPHGSMVLRVEIPDQFVTMLQATAEAMNKPLEEYFGEIVQGGLENGWFF